MLQTEYIKNTALKCQKCMGLYSLSAFPFFLLHSLHFLLSTLALISSLLHLTDDWTPPGVQSKFHTWSGSGNQLENLSSIFTSCLHSISSLSSYSYPLLAHTSSFLSSFFFLCSIISSSPSSILPCYLVDIMDTSTFLTACSTYTLLPHSHIPLCYKVHS